MEEKFDIQRLLALCSHFWVEMRGRLILPALMAGVLFAAINWLHIQPDTSPIMMFGLLSVGKTGFTVILIYHIHLAFSRKGGQVRSRALYLLPASVVEKFLALLLTAFALPLLFYVGLYAVVNGFFMLLFDATYLSFSEFLFANPVGEYFGKIAIAITLYSGLTSYLLLQFLIFGQLYFKKQPILKTVGGLYLAFNLFGLFAFQIGKGPFIVDFFNSIKQYAIDKPDDFVQSAWYLFILFFTLISSLFYVNYLKFKKKEIKA